MKYEFDMLQETYRHALAKRFREVERNEGPAILEECRRRLLEASDGAKTPRISQRRRLTVAQRRAGPPVAVLAEFWSLAYRLFCYQQAAALSNADFIRLCPLLRHTTSWIKIKRGNFLKFYPLLADRWLVYLRTTCEMLEKEEPAWQDRKPAVASADLKKAEIRMLAHNLRVRQLAAKKPIREFCGHHVSPKTFLARLMPGIIPDSSVDGWLQKLRSMAVT